jgi:hypothetical protein
MTDIEPKIYTIKTALHGVVTVAYAHQYETRTIRVGFSFCSPYDMYNKKLGAEIATNRFKHFCITVSDVHYYASGKTNYYVTFINYMRKCLDENQDLRVAFGVWCYNKAATPQEKESFRWWLNIFLALLIEKKERKPEPHIVELLPWISKSKKTPITLS